MRLWIACVAACATTPSAPPHHAPPAVSADPHARDAARRRADEALHTDLRLDYERPFKPYAPPDRSATAALFGEACRDGDKHACIVEAELRPLDATGSAFQSVLASCMAGDAVSCRALPKDDTLARFPGAPGAASRSAACQHDRDTCGVDDLRRECRDGFPAACYALHVKLDDDVALDRFITLTKDGCRHGIASECEVSDGDDRNRFEMAQRWCDLRPESCITLAQRDEQRSDKAAAREHWERVCQFGENYWGVCIQLAEKYVAGELEEPVPGRAQQLLDWGCPQLIAKAGSQMLDRLPGCKSAKRP